METFGPGTNLPILFREALPLCLPKVIVSNRVSAPDNANVKAVSTSELRQLLSEANILQGPEHTLGWTKYTNSVECTCKNEEKHCIIECDIIVDAIIYLNSDDFHKNVSIRNSNGIRKTGPAARGIYGHERKHILAMHDLIQEFVIKPMHTDSTYSHLTSGNCGLLLNTAKQALTMHFKSTLDPLRDNYLVPYDDSKGPNSAYRNAPEADVFYEPLHMTDQFKAAVGDKKYYEYPE